jgi:hypothetical protein
MKEIKLELIKDGQSTGSEVHGDLFADDPDEDGTTYLCGGCEKPIIEGFVPDFIDLAGVDLVCQHCGVHNYLDTTKS